MKVVDILKSGQKTKFTFEIVPPAKGSTLQDISSIIEILRPCHPAYINITCHQAEMVLEERPDGSFIKKEVTKKPSIVSVAAAIKFKYGIEVVPHLICGGFNISETEDALFDFSFLGINNVFALRGDAPKGQRYFVAEENGHKNAAGLVKQIKDMNEGRFFSPNIKNTAVTDFCIGVAGYPEKHCESPNLDTDIGFLKQKVASGADYIVTQMFYDNQKFFNFVEKCRHSGINVPIIPGIKPISLLANLNNLPQIFHIDLPAKLANEVKKCKSDQDVEKVGIEWAVNQCVELLRYEIPAIHFFTLGNAAKNIAKIVDTVF
jgi:methylenetetrahydrofolate reductase (NADPH)